MKKSLLLAIIVIGCFNPIQGQDVEAFVSSLIKQYPQARLLDIYKSCFQDVMGAEHLVADTASARAYLEYELSVIANVDSVSPQAFEPCCINGNYVRVSLNVIRNGFVDIDKLLEAFISSANDTNRPTVAHWAEVWHELIKTIDSMNLDLPCYEQDRQFINTVLEQGQYAISHSPEYREAYSPHYRIVKREIFEREIMPLLIKPQSVQSQELPF